MRWRAWCLALIAGAVLAGAASARPVVVTDDRGRQLTLADPPQRIVTLSPALTETICALGACARLVGTDRHSNWPASVPALPKLGGLDDAQIERIVALRPGLVLAAVSTRAVERLEALGLTVLAFEPRTVADVQRVLDAVAAVLGTPQAGPAAWQRLEQRIAAAAARVPVALRGRRVYFEVAAEPYAAGAGSFVGELLARLGLANVVPAALGPFPRLNPEYVLRAQPDIVMATSANLAEMPSRPGWAGLAALRTGMTCGFPPRRFDPLMRAGPRLGEAAESLADCLASLPMPVAQR